MPMVRETRYLLVGNLPETTTENEITEYFKRFGKIQKVKLERKAEGSDSDEKEEGCITSLTATVAFTDIKSASNAHKAEKTIGSNVLSSEYSTGFGATGSVVKRTHEPEIYPRPPLPAPYPNRKGFEEEADGFDVYYGPTPTYSESSYPSPSFAERGRPRDRWVSGAPFPGRGAKWAPGTSRQYSDSSSKDGFEKPKPTTSSVPASSPASHTSSKKKTKKSVDRSRSRSSSNSSRSSSSDSDSASQSSSKERPKAKSDTHESEMRETEIEPGEREPLGVLIRRLPLRSSDTSLRDGLFHEYKKYGKITAVQIFGANDTRYAIISFKQAEDAHKALEASREKRFFGSQIQVEQHEGLEAEDCEFLTPEAQLDEHSPKATRTLFLGNLDKEISIEELKERLEKYGDILDVDVKRQGAVTAYAFIQFTDITSVVKALKDLDGTTWGATKLKVGFGKSMATPVVWLGNLADTVHEGFLCKQFARFGALTHTVVDRETHKGLVFFMNVESAQYALPEMRNRIWNGKKIHIDYASRDCQESFFKKMEQSNQLRPGERPDARWMQKQMADNPHWEETSTFDPNATFNKNTRGTFNQFGRARGRFQRGRGFFRGRGGGPSFEGAYPTDEFAMRRKNFDEFSQGSGPYLEDDYEQALREYGHSQRERHERSSQSPPGYDEVYYERVERASQSGAGQPHDFEYDKRRFGSYRSLSPSSDREMEVNEEDFRYKPRTPSDERYYFSKTYEENRSRERSHSSDSEQRFRLSSEVVRRRSRSRSPTLTKVKRTNELPKSYRSHSPPTVTEDEAYYHSDNSPTDFESAYRKYADYKKRPSSSSVEGDRKSSVLINTGLRIEIESKSEERSSRKRSYDQLSPKRSDSLHRQHSRGSRADSLYEYDRGEKLSAKDLISKVQRLRSEVNERLGVKDSPSSSSNSDLDPSTLTEADIIKLQREKNKLIQKLTQMEESGNISDNESDSRHGSSKKARLDVKYLQKEKLKKLDDSSRKQLEAQRKKELLREYKKSKSLSESVKKDIMDYSEEDSYSLNSPREYPSGFMPKKRRKVEGDSERKNRSYRARPDDEQGYSSDDDKERADLLRLSGAHSDMYSSKSRTVSSLDARLESAEFGSHSKEDSRRVSSGSDNNKEHSEHSGRRHRRHKNKENHITPLIPLGDDIMPDPETCDPRSLRDKCDRPLVLPLPDFAQFIQFSPLPSPHHSPERYSDLPSDSGRDKLRESAADSGNAETYQSPCFSPQSSSSKTHSPSQSPSGSGSDTKANTNSDSGSGELPLGFPVETDQPDPDVNKVDSLDSNPNKVATTVTKDHDDSFSDNNSDDNLTSDNLSIEERIRQLDEKWNRAQAVVTHKVVPDVDSMVNNSVTSSTSTLLTPFTSSQSVTTAVASPTTSSLYSKYKIRKRNDTTGAGCEKGDGPSEIVATVLSKSSIFDQDSKRLGQINETTDNVKETSPSIDNSSKLYSSWNKLEVKENPMVTVPGSLMDRLGQGSNGSFPTLTVNTTFPSSTNVSMNKTDTVNSSLYDNRTSKLSPLPPLDLPGVSENNLSVKDDLAIVADKSPKFEKNGLGSELDLTEKSPIVPKSILKNKSDDSLKNLDILENSVEVQVQSCTTSDIKLENGYNEKKCEIETKDLTDSCNKSLDHLSNSVDISELKSEKLDNSTIEQMDIADDVVNTSGKPTAEIIKSEAVDTIKTKSVSGNEESNKIVTNVENSCDKPKIDIKVTDNTPVDIKVEEPSGTYSTKEEPKSDIKVEKAEVEMDVESSKEKVKVEEKVTVAKTSDKEKHSNKETSKSEKDGAFKEPTHKKPKLSKEGSKDKKSDHKDDKHKKKDSEKKSDSAHKSSSDKKDEKHKDKHKSKSDKDKKDSEKKSKEEKKEKEEKKKKVEKKEKESKDDKTEKESKEDKHSKEKKEDKSDEKKKETESKEKSDKKEKKHEKKEGHKHDKHGLKSPDKKSKSSHKEDENKDSKDKTKEASAKESTTKESVQKDAEKEKPDKPDKEKSDKKSESSSSKKEHKSSSHKTKKSRDESSKKVKDESQESKKKEESKSKEDESKKTKDEAESKKNKDDHNEHKKKDEGGNRNNKDSPDKSKDVNRKGSAEKKSSEKGKEKTSSGEKCKEEKTKSKEKENKDKDPDHSKSKSKNQSSSSETTEKPKPQASETKVEKHKSEDKEESKKSESKTEDKKSKEGDSSKSASSSVKKSSRDVDMHKKTASSKSEKPNKQPKSDCKNELKMKEKVVQDNDHKNKKVTPKKKAMMEDKDAHNGLTEEDLAIFAQFADESCISMYDKVKRRSTEKKLHHEREHEEQKKLICEYKRKSSKKMNLSDISESSELSSDDERKKLGQNNKKKYAFSSGDSESTTDPASSILQKKTKTKTQSKKPKRILDIYSSDSEEEEMNVKSPSKKSTSLKKKKAEVHRENENKFDFDSISDSDNKTSATQHAKVKTKPKVNKKQSKPKTELKPQPKTDKRDDINKKKPKLQRKDLSFKDLFDDSDESLSMLSDSDSDSDIMIASKAKKKPFMNRNDKNNKKKLPRGSSIYTSSEDSESEEEFKPMSPPKTTVLPKKPEKKMTPFKEPLRKESDSSTSDTDISFNKNKKGTKKNLLNKKHQNSSFDSDSFLSDPELNGKLDKIDIKRHKDDKTNNKLDHDRFTSSVLENSLKKQKSKEKLEKEIHKFNNNKKLHDIITDDGRFENLSKLDMTKVYSETMYEKDTLLSNLTNKDNLPPILEDISKEPLFKLGMDSVRNDIPTLKDINLEEKFSKMKNKKHKKKENKKNKKNKEKSSKDSSKEKVEGCNNKMNDMKLDSNQKSLDQVDSLKHDSDLENAANSVNRNLFDEMKAKITPENKKSKNRKESSKPVKEKPVAHYEERLSDSDFLSDSERKKMHKADKAVDRSHSSKSINSDVFDFQEEDSKIRPIKESHMKIIKPDSYDVKVSGDHDKDVDTHAPVEIQGVEIEYTTDELDYKDDGNVCPEVETTEVVIEEAAEVKVEKEKKPLKRKGRKNSRKDVVEGLGDVTEEAVSSLSNDSKNQPSVQTEIVTFEAPASDEQELVIDEGVSLHIDPEEENEKAVESIVNDENDETAKAVESILLDGMPGIPAYSDSIHISEPVEPTPQLDQNYLQPEFAPGLPNPVPQVGTEVETSTANTPLKGKKGRKGRRTKSGQGDALLNENSSKLPDVKSFDILGDSAFTDISNSIDQNDDDDDGGRLQIDFDPPKPEAKQKKPRKPKQPKVNKMNPDAAALAAENKLDLFGNFSQSQNKDELNRDSLSSENSELERTKHEDLLFMDREDQRHDSDMMSPDERSTSDDLTSPDVVKIKPKRGRKPKNKDPANAPIPRTNSPRTTRTLSPRSPRNNFDPRSPEPKLNGPKNLTIDEGIKAGTNVFDFDENDETATNVAQPAQTTPAKQRKPRQRKKGEPGLQSPENRGMFSSPEHSDKLVIGSPFSPEHKMANNSWDKKGLFSPSFQPEEQKLEVKSVADDKPPEPLFKAFFEAKSKNEKEPVNPLLAKKGVTTPNKEGENKPPLTPAQIMSNVDKTIEDVSKGLFESTDDESTSHSEQTSQKKRQSRKSKEEDIKSPGVKSPLKSPMMKSPVMNHIGSPPPSIPTSHHQPLVLPGMGIGQSSAQAPIGEPQVAGHVGMFGQMSPPVSLAASRAQGIANSAPESAKSIMEMPAKSVSEKEALVTLTTPPKTTVLQPISKSPVITSIPQTTVPVLSSKVSPVQDTRKVEVGMEGALKSAMPGFLLPGISASAAMNVVQGISSAAVCTTQTTVVASTATELPSRSAHIDKVPQEPIQQQKIAEQKFADQKLAEQKQAEIQLQKQQEHHVKLKEMELKKQQLEHQKHLEEQHKKLQEVMKNQELQKNKEEVLKKEQEKKRLEEQYKLLLQQQQEQLQRQQALQVAGVTVGPGIQPGQQPLLSPGALARLRPGLPSPTDGKTGVRPPISPHHPLAPGAFSLPGALQVRPGQFPAHLTPAQIQAMQQHLVSPLGQDKPPTSAELVMKHQQLQQKIQVQKAQQQALAEQQAQLAKQQAQNQAKQNVQQLAGGKQPAGPSGKNGPLTPGSKKSSEPQRPPTSQGPAGPAVHGPAVHGPAIHGPAIHGPAVHGKDAAPLPGSQEAANQLTQQIRQQLAMQAQQQQQGHPGSHGGPPHTPHGLPGWQMPPLRPEVPGGPGGPGPVPRQPGPQGPMTGEARTSMPGPVPVLGGNPQQVQRVSPHPPTKSPTVAQTAPNMVLGFSQHQTAAPRAPSPAVAKTAERQGGPNGAKWAGSGTTGPSPRPGQSDVRPRVPSTEAGPTTSRTEIWPAINAPPPGPASLSPAPRPAHQQPPSAHQQQPDTLQLPRPPAPAERERGNKDKFLQQQHYQELQRKHQQELQRQQQLRDQALHAQAQKEVQIHKEREEREKRESQASLATQGQSDPRQPDPRQPDPRQPDPRQPDPRQSDPRQPDPRQPDPRQPDPRQPDPRQPDPRQPSAVRMGYPFVEPRPPSRDGGKMQQSPAIVDPRDPRFTQQFPGHPHPADLRMGSSQSSAFSPAPGNSADPAHMYSQADLQRLQNGLIPAYPPGIMMREPHLIPGHGPYMLPGHLAYMAHTQQQMEHQHIVDGRPPSRGTSRPPSNQPTHTVSPTQQTPADNRNQTRSQTQPMGPPSRDAHPGDGSLLSLLQRYPVMWQGVLGLKNDQCVVQMHFISGYQPLVKMSLPQQAADGTVLPLRIAQRMRLEQTQLEGVAKRMQMEKDYCMMLALPCGRDHTDIYQQTRAMSTGFIQYLQQKQAAGIVNVADPGSQQPAYVVHIFPPCDFSQNTLSRLGFDLLYQVKDLAHLIVIIATVG